MKQAYIQYTIINSTYNLINIINIIIVLIYINFIYAYKSCGKIKEVGIRKLNIQP